MLHRTIILVTHHVDLVLPVTHYLVRMAEGQVEYQGTVDSLYEERLLSRSVGEENQETGKIALNMKPNDDGLLPSVYDEAPPVADPAPGTNVKCNQPRKLVLDEKREVGNVKWPIYRTYLNAS